MRWRDWSLLRKWTRYKLTGRRNLSSRQRGKSRWLLRVLPVYLQFLCGSLSFLLTFLYCFIVQRFGVLAQLLLWSSGRGIVQINCTKWCISNKLFWHDNTGGLTVLTMCISNIFDLRQCLVHGEICGSLQLLNSSKFQKQISAESDPADFLLNHIMTTQLSFLWIWTRLCIQVSIIHRDFLINADRRQLCKIKWSVWIFGM